MQCPSCGNDTNPTLIYCMVCGAPVEADVEDVIADEQLRSQQLRMVEATREAQKLMVLAVFLLGSVILARVVLLKRQHYDYTVGYRLPYSVIKERAQEPSDVLEVPTLEIPLPQGE